MIYMKTNFLRKSAIAVFTMTAASFYFAQEQEPEKENTIDEVVIVAGVADIAKDRKTPVAVSTIKEGAIVEKLGNQEFPEILNTTPSVYATKAGGGFGDSGIRIRGFGNENIAIMVNGMPVNDMESSKVYWSNWSGLSDVASAMQVQRGLGASKLAIASVGGTINIITRAADKKKGGLLSVGVGNNGYHKTQFSYNTGKSASGWSSSFLLGRTAGAMYADGTDFEGYTYYFAVGYQPNEKHDFQFMVTGAPQKHNQRGIATSISDYLRYGGNGVDRPNRRYNPLRGYLNGKEYVWSENYYHKPVAMFNWDWKINENNRLASVFYASIGRGGGSGRSPFIARNFNNYRVSDVNREDYGLLDFEKMVRENSLTPNAPKIARVVSTNDHNWYGFLTNFTHKFSEKLQLSLGLDGRYYKGFHMQALTDLFGAESYTDSRNENTGARVITSTHNIDVPFLSKVKADAVSYNNDGEVLWGGVFGQLEYSDDNLSAFVQGSISSQGYQRFDHFVKPGKLAIAKDPESKMYTKTGFHYQTGYNIKAGVNYNINENHNVFGNIGYYEKQPIFNTVYPNFRNYLNSDLNNEKIFGAELGYSFRSADFNANLNLYRTSWKDRYLSVGNNFDEYILQGGAYKGTGRTIRGNANILGITQVHMGVEVDAEYKFSEGLSFTGMFSLGDWKYKGNASASYLTETAEAIVDANGNPVEDKTLYLDGVKVGDAAHLTAGLGLKLNPISGLSVFADWKYVDRLYAGANAQNFDKADHKGSLRLPSYNLLDMGISYKLDIGNGQSFTFRGNVYNVLDTYYIAESITNFHATEASETYKGVDVKNEVYFGAGRTWSASVSFNF